ncbi:MAG: hypothetical protein R3D33_03085 [Hyphomicrobiaceae bacterium]
MRLLGADIGGNLECSSGTFRNRTPSGGGVALGADGLKTGGTVFLDDSFSAEGEVRLLGADIGVDLACMGGTFDNAVARAGRPQGASPQPYAADALTIDKARIAGTLWLGPAAKPNDQPVTLKGSLDLQGAHAKLLVDDPASWPGGAGGAVIQGPGGAKIWAAIKLDGFTYDRFSGVAPTDADTRLKWLARQPHVHRITSFRPQPYEQLAKVLSEMGHERGARTIAKAREKAERRARLANAWPGFPWALPRRRDHVAGTLAAMLLLGLLAGYGYGFKRLVGMMLALWLAGAGLYALAADQGRMAPSNPLIFNDPVLQAACTGHWADCGKLPDEVTAYSPLIHSLDVVLPIVSLDVEADWAPLFVRPDPVAGTPGSVVVIPTDDPYILKLPWPTVTLPYWALRLFYWSQILLGWALSALLVAVLTGVMKRQ